MISERLQSAIDLRVSGHVPEAVQALQAIIEQPEDFDERIGAQLNLVTAHMLLGALPAARAVWQDARRLASTRPEIEPYLGSLEARLLKEEGKIDEAAARFEQLLNDHANILQWPEHRELYEDIQRQRADALIHLGCYRQALPIVEETLGFNNTAADKSRILCQLADCYLDVSDYEAAKSYLESARELGIPAAWQGHAHYALGVAYAQLGLLRDAKRELELCESRLDEYDLPYRDLYTWLAVVFNKLGETDKAREYKRLSLSA